MRTSELQGWVGSEGEACGRWDEGCHPVLSPVLVAVTTSCFLLSLLDSRLTRLSCLVCFLQMSAQQKAQGLLSHPLVQQGESDPSPVCLPSPDRLGSYPPALHVD